MLTAKLTTREEHRQNLAQCEYTPAEAAKALGVSESTVRRVSRQLGVKKFGGPTIAGFVRFASHPVDVSMPYSE